MFSSLVRFRLVTGRGKCEIGEEKRYRRVENSTSVHSALDEVNQNRLGGFTEEVNKFTFNISQRKNKKLLKSHH